jgi:hypothetical protein
MFLLSPSNPRSGLEGWGEGQGYFVKEKIFLDLTFKLKKILKKPRIIF